MTKSEQKSQERIDTIKIDSQIIEEKQNNWLHCVDIFARGGGGGRGIHICRLALKSASAPAEIINCKYIINTASC